MDLEMQSKIGLKIILVIENNMWIIMIINL